MENKYKLVGCINLLGVVPDGIYPVYEKGGKYYGGFANGLESRTTRIEYFQKWRKDVLEYIVFIDDIINDPNYSLVLDSVKPYYEVGDESVFVHQLDNNEFYFGNPESFLKFLKEHKGVIDEVINSGIKEAIDDICGKYNIEEEFARNIYLNGLQRDIDDLEDRISRKVKK